ncbi:MAG: F0F1 ATP synthase subunit gamma [Nostocaceae cyanobacterium]|nr:F0F1 ATP synthase subunit gamma [Nostocaceae cyanobacterium]
MPSLDHLQRQITTAKELQSVVRTMKVLSAASIRQYERAVESLAEYTRTIEMGLQIVLRDYAKSGISHSGLTNAKSGVINRWGAIVFGSDQGMCGQFNEQIGHYVLEQISQLSPTTYDLSLLTVGTRVIPPLETGGQKITASFSMPSSLAGITPMVQELLLYIEKWREDEQISQILLFYHHLHSNTSFQPRKLQILPIEQTWLQQLQKQQWDSRSLPTFTMERSQLFATLVRQYLFVSLYRAFGESLASENASRLASMQMAEQNIEERLAEFNTQFQQERQTAITEEILEIVAGADALAQ